MSQSKGGAMVKGLFLRGDAEEGFRLYYGIVVEQIWAGIAKNQRTGELYPSIDLYYSRDVLAKVLVFLTEVTKLNSWPKVYIQTKQNIYQLVVLFRLKPVRQDFLSTLLTESSVAIPEPGRVSEVIMTAEADFPLEDVQPFLQSFREKGYYRLYIGAIDEPPEWGMQFFSIEERLPYSLEQERLF